MRNSSYVYADTFRGLRVGAVAFGRWFRAGWYGPGYHGKFSERRRLADNSGWAFHGLQWSRYRRHCWHLSFGCPRLSVGFSWGLTRVVGGPTGRYRYPKFRTS